MQELIAKIEQLRKAIAGIPKKTTLVPSLKPPSVKPLSMPSSKPSAPIKLPGAAPISGKDPKMVADQLKNPRPKKPKVEVLKTDKNGQWSLEKSDETTQIHSHLPPHVAKLGEGVKPGTSSHKNYVDAAHDWHDKVHAAVMKDNPHLRHSFGEGLHPRIHGYNGALKSTSALDKLHRENKTNYSLGGDGH